jgi:drug/metabolite transporter (DMT)-like permease
VRPVTNLIAASPAAAGLSAPAPALSAAKSFSVTDILLEVANASGMDVPTLLSLRGLLVVGFFFVWLRIAPPSRWPTPRERRIALGLGLLFAMTMFGLLKAIFLLPVSIAILACFVYLRLTGLGAAITRMGRLGWCALLAAGVAFKELTLMLGEQIGGLSTMGLAFAFGAANARGGGDDRVALRVSVRAAKLA